ncbi:DUF2115 family protein [Methanobrevibacter curvatus]|uniref:UPF0305 protein MBCUR_07830 n=1 Tax=Methanobrevibacter curvatus TaxID=49547 RepID=A0A162FHE5_9EURY|nr:DUF2115 family protein [Methanobrevibacter curvatus]KZX13095.1 hypothetical protein MBCUR_07830 [Methanobrevibacter curvatus]
MFKDFKKLKSKEIIYKNDLLDALKKYAKNISIFDIMSSTSNFRDACKYVRDEYKGHFDDIYIKNFYMKVAEIGIDDKEYNEKIHKKKYLKAIDFFSNQDENREEEDPENEFKKQRQIYYLICIYTTFILEEPIHAVGSIFPGHTKVREDNGKFYCPVKANNTTNPKAVCRFCLAHQG